MHLPVVVERWLAQEQRGVHSAQACVELAFLHDQMQVEAGKFEGQARQAWNDPAGKHAARASEYQCGGRVLATKISAGVLQLLERAARGVPQLLSGRRQAQAAALADEERLAQITFKCLDLSAHGAMGHMQFPRRQGHALQASGSLEGMQGIEGGQFPGH